MLKPIEALQQYGQSTGMDATELQRKQEKLLDVLLHPARADHGENVVAVFAHGAEAMRLAAIKLDGDRYPHWAVQTWSAMKEDWLTQKSYDMKPEMRDLAYLDAKTWYRVPTQAEAELKWAAISSSDEGALDRLFDSRVKLAEFWYETKVVDWGMGHDPWPLMSAVAKTAFEHDGRPHPLLGEQGQKVAAQLANFTAKWEMADAKKRAVELGDRIRFTPNEERSAMGGVVVDGVVMDVATTSSGNTRYRIRTDRVSPLDGELLDWNIYTNYGSIEQLPARDVFFGPATQAAAALRASHQFGQEYSPLTTWHNLSETAYQHGLVAAVRLIDENEGSPSLPRFQVNYASASDGAPTGIKTGILIDGKAVTSVNGETISAAATESHEAQSSDLVNAFARERSLSIQAQQQMPAELETQPKEDEYVISIYSERWTEEDKEAGEPGERLVEVERETVDADELQRYGWDHGISEASASDPRAAPHLWFFSTEPDMDREYFEEGIDKYYSLHIHEMNGREPGAEDYQKVANLIGVKFDRPIELADDKMRDPIYGYYINLDERGDFYADVRDAGGRSVYEIHAGNSLGEDESSIFDDGYMRDKHDIAGLTEYLRSLGVIEQDAEIKKMADFERLLEASDDSEMTIG